MARPRILCLSFDRVVGENRRSALVESGYEVATLLKVQEALSALEQGGFDIVIIGHRFPKDDKTLLAIEAQKRGVKVLLVCGESGDAGIPADARVFALEGALGLLAAIPSLLAARAA